MICNYVNAIFFQPNGILSFLFFCNSSISFSRFYRDIQLYLDVCWLNVCYTLARYLSHNYNNYIKNPLYRHYVPYVPFHFLTTYLVMRFSYMVIKANCTRFLLLMIISVTWVTWVTFNRVIYTRSILRSILPF